MQKIRKFLLIVRVTNTEGETSLGYDTKDTGMTPWKTGCIHTSLFQKTKQDQGHELG